MDANARPRNLSDDCPGSVSTVPFNLTNATVKIPQIAPLEFRIVATVVHVIIFLVGFFGNIAVVIVVRKTKSMHTPTYCYLVSLAIADLIVLVSAMPEAIMSHHMYTNTWTLGHFGCSLLVFGNFLGINASSTSILCFTIERYIGICHPLRAQTICSNNRAVKILIGTWVFAVLYSSPWLGLTMTAQAPYPGHPELQQCKFRLDRQQYVGFFLADLFLFYIMPLLVSIVLYAQIGIVLQKSLKSDLRKSTRRGNGRAMVVTAQSSQSGAIVTGSVVRKSTNAQQDRARNIQVVQMLLVVVTLFAVLWLPYRGLLVYNSFFTPPWINFWYLFFAKTLIYINSAINPVLYNAMSKRFRTEFCRHIFGIRRSAEITETLNNSLPLSISKAMNTRYLATTPSVRSSVNGYCGGTRLSSVGAFDGTSKYFPRDMTASVSTSLKGSPPTNPLLMKKSDSDEE